ncbi:MAG: sigma-70 family RNA polymerase sigma factor [Bacteroidales bacterium]|nr:sigma-70 family RNA polymerase sigma factor [Bacteroidales bacterium]
MFLKFSKYRTTFLKQGKALSDEELIKKYQKSENHEIIGELFERYTHLVYGVCLKYLKNEDDAKDAVMQIFESLIDKLINHNINNFKSWLYSVTKNFCLMELRKEKQFVSLEGEMFKKREYEFVESSDKFHQLNETDIDMPKEIQKALGQLSKEQEICIELLYLKQKSYKEVSELTGYSLKQVKSYVQNGKRNLKKILDKINETS